MFTSIKEFRNFLTSKGYVNFSTLDCIKGIFFDADTQKYYYVINNDIIEHNI